MRLNSEGNILELFDDSEDSEDLESSNSLRSNGDQLSHLNQLRKKSERQIGQKKILKPKSVLDLQENTKEKDKHSRS